LALSQPDTWLTESAGKMMMMMIIMGVSDWEKKGKFQELGLGLRT